MRQKWLKSLAALSVTACCVSNLVSSVADARESSRSDRQTPAAPAESELRLLPVQGNVYLLSGADVNITVQLGTDGVLLVDTPPSALLPQAVAAIRKVSSEPIRYVITTALDRERTAGDESVAAMGEPLPGTQFFNSGAGLVAAGGGNGGVTVLAHENVLSRLTALGKGGMPGALVTSEYFTSSKDFFMNQEAIIVYHLPAAHTDGDSLVFFRRSDVLSTGDLFTPGQYPRIDVDRGGSVQGLLAALNRILEIAVPGAYQERGTYVIPGRGRLCDEAEVVEYRDMVKIVSDRIQNSLQQGQNLQQIIASRPTEDYDTEYLFERGGPSAEEFVKAVYRSLTQAKPAGAAL